MKNKLLEKINTKISNDLGVPNLKLHIRYLKEQNLSLVIVVI
jgi:hypothetical protein